MRTLVLALVPCLALAMTAERQAFEEFRMKFGKTYNMDEEPKRFEAFKATLQRVKSSQNPTHGITSLADLTPEEFRAQYLTPNRGPKPDTTNAPTWDGECSACKRFPEIRNMKFGADSAWDWTSKGAVTAIKNQGQCGSCWTFGTTGDIEGVWFLGNNTMTPLSEQMIVSCNTAQGGCNGGWQSDAMEWIIKQGGIVAEPTYPYTSGNGTTGTCDTAHESPKVAKISSWFQVSKNGSQEDEIVKQLPLVGPITIDINAEHMQDYNGGIDHPIECDRTSLDHAVLIVGFGESNGIPYWKIKNSWGPSWGESGYYRIVRGLNMCGLANNAVHSKL
ncbi:Cysteine proteinase [Diplonema papillatum]|nr:Cysteine proteinase [Diplonema papillatum]